MKMMHSESDQVMDNGKNYLQYKCLLIADCIIRLHPDNMHAPRTLYDVPEQFQEYSAQNKKC